MLKMPGWARAFAFLGSLLASGSAFAYTGAKWNLPVGVTEISQEVHRLHMLIFWICVVIAVVVFGVMFYSVFAHRKSRHPKPADFHESTLVEIIWTTIPFVILIGMAIPAAATLVRMDDTRNSDMTVKITGYQWKWQYEYIGEDVSFFSTLAAESNKARQLKSGIDVNTVPNYLVDVDNPLVLPVGKKVRFLITSNDVIHAWWVSEIAVKKDAIPGYVNEIWTKIDQPGTYRGVCAELCGRDHGFMPIVVKALPADEYEAWLASKKSGATTVAAAAPATATDAAPAAAEAPATAAVEEKTEVAAAAAPAEAKPAAAPAADGEKTYKANCAACHQPTGAGAPPTFPALVGGKIVTGSKDGVVGQILHGKNMMPPFPQLSDAEIAAVSTYIRSSWGNKADAVSAADVAAQRK